MLFISLLNSTDSPVVQNVQFPHMPSGTTSLSPKYAARFCARPVLQSQGWRVWVVREGLTHNRRRWRIG